MNYIKTVFSFMIFFIFISCGNESKNQSNSKTDIKEMIKKDLSGKNKNDNASACDFLSESYLTQKFTGATDFQPKSSEKPYPRCRYTFTVNGETYYVGLTLLKGNGSEAMLDSGTKPFPKKELLSGVGGKAYYIKTMNQVSAWEGNHLIHVNFSDPTPAKNKDIAIEIAKDILKLL
ncbi:MAG: hypothetical protein V3V16_00555 [Melioribacteraceae bacterium]